MNLTYQPPKRLDSLPCVFVFAFDREAPPDLTAAVERCGQSGCSLLDACVLKTQGKEVHVELGEEAATLGAGKYRLVLSRGCDECAQLPFLLDYSCGAFTTRKELPPPFKEECPCE